MTVSYPRLILYGLITYAATFMLWALLAAYGMNYGWGAQAASYVLLATVVFAAARALKVADVKSSLAYGLGWALIHLLMDILYVVPVAGFLALVTPYPWISYAVVLLTTLGAALYDRAKSPSAQLPASS